MQDIRNPYLIQIFFVFVLGVATTFLITPVSIRLAKKFDIVDRPHDDRRMHMRAKPRFGGLSIVFGSVIALVVPAYENPNIRIAILGGILMYFLGAYDDIHNIKPLQKFVGQLAISTMMYAMGIRVTFISNYFGTATDNPNANLILSNGLAFLITVIWITGVTNAINLMDGLDGLAAGSSAIMMLSMAYIAYIHGNSFGRMSVCVALVAIAASCIGFLPYNFSPAKTFMGDGGALYLGFMLATLSVISPLKRATFVAVVVPVLALAIPIFDTLYAIIRRALRHESIMQADKEHLHHRLMAAGFGQRRSVLVIYGIVGIMGRVSVLISRELYLDAFFLSMIAALYLGIILVRKQPKKKTYAQVKAIAKKRRERQKNKK